MKLKTDNGGQRLDKFLAESYPTLSRSRIQRLISDGYVTVDGRQSKPAFRLGVGQTVFIVEESDITDLNLPQPPSVNVIHEDHDIVIIDKPPGLVVHPTSRRKAGTLANGLLALYPEMEGIAGLNRAGIVHRLDKDTSGLMVVARTQIAHSNLKDQFRDRRIAKKYQALVVGELKSQEAVIDAPIGRHARRRERMAAVHHGRPANTPYRTLERYSKYTFVEAYPKTGRTHQIRVHFAAIGHPLVGDTIYGSRHPCLKRQFLHASFIEFMHPSSGITVHFSSELPTDLRGFLHNLK